jgi:16S rRNA (uracil1498-N3)-methyltransferase
VTIDLEGPRIPVAEPAVSITLGVGLLKGDQMDAVVRDATVLGASRIVPMLTQHVTVPERVWAREKLEARWLRVAIAAAKQCGRAVVPEIAAVTPMDDVIAGAGEVVRVVCVEPAHGGTATGLGPKPAAALLCIGPEGGWSAAELARLSPGARQLSLGPRTLRAELAPVVALTAVWSAWGWA